MKVNDYSEKLIAKSKRRIVVWYILAVLMLITALAMIITIAAIPEIPDWAEVLMSLLTFVSGQGFVCFLFLVNLERDRITELQYYVRVIKEYEE